MSIKINVNSTFVYIVGLGWLGVPLANAFANIGYNVSGTVRSNYKQNQLISRNLNADLLNLTADYCTGFNDLTCFEAGRAQSNRRNVIINIPPGRQLFNKEIHVHNMKSLIDDFMNKGVTKLIFISTTSVYGKATNTVNLNTPLQPVTDSGKAHVEIEQHILSNYSAKSVIIRPAGLVGPNVDHGFRHPIFTLVKKGRVRNSLDAVNLVHQKDLINAIIRSAEINKAGVAINLACLDNPTKKEYYTWCATKLELPIPKFENEQFSGGGKKIDATPSLDLLGNLNLDYSSVFDLLD